MKLGLHSVKQLLALVFVVASFSTSSKPIPQCHTTEATEEIIQQRNQFNKAIRDAYIEPIAATLSDTVILITGSDSVLLNGKQAQLDVWQSDFDNGAERDIYLRTTQCVTISSLGSMAMEYGQWKGSRDSSILYSGTYSAKWRFNEANQSWLLEAEIYMTDFVK